MTSANNHQKSANFLLHISFLLAITLLILQGCGRHPRKPPVAPPPPVIREIPPVKKELTPPEKKYEKTAIINQFIIQAKTQHENGNNKQAVATLERGLRIAPKDAQLWSYLAEIKLDQHQYQQALSFAKKSNAVAGNNAAIFEKNLKIIEKANRRLAPHILPSL